MPQLNRALSLNLRDVIARARARACRRSVSAGIGRGDPRLRRGAEMIQAGARRRGRCARERERPRGGDAGREGRAVAGARTRLVVGGTLRGPAVSDGGVSRRGFLAEAAGLATLSALAESTSQPPALALTARAALSLARLAALWAAGASATPLSVAPASYVGKARLLPRSEESSGGAGRVATRASASSTSRSCAHVMGMC